MGSRHTRPCSDNRWPSGSPLTLTPGRVAPGVDAPPGRLSYMSPRQSKPTRAEQLVLDLATPAVARNEPLLGAAEAAGLLSVRVSWIYDAARCGRVPCVRIGRHVRFLRSDLERWVADQRGQRPGSAAGSCASGPGTRNARSANAAPPVGSGA